jgi:subtilisin-like proprotein convertase family protein
MKILKLTILFSILFIQISKAQLLVNLTSDFGNDTIKTCVSTKITFYASTTNAGLPVTGVTYKWDFDDNENETGIDLDTVEHIFSSQKGFRVRVIAEYNGEKTHQILPVEIGLIADFSETKTDIAEKQSGICPGEEFQLKGVAKDYSWTGEFLTNRAEFENIPYEIEFPYVYTAPIDHKEFIANDTLSLGNQIETIGLKIEHENLSNIQIKFICPDETEIILKDFGGEPKYLGEPVLDDVGTAGIPYWYYWNNSPEYSTMNIESANFETLPTGNYLPENLFDNLVGCPLNGEWSIIVIDSVTSDNGFITEWLLTFDEDFLPDTFNYTNNYSLETGNWSGEGANQTNTEDGTCDVESSLIPGIYSYNFIIKDNFGCESDTTLDITVERANSTVKSDIADPVENEISANIGDNLTFNDKTSWSVETRWDFGDDSDNKFEKDVIHYYLDEAHYRVLMMATSAKGCVDYDTVYVEMSAKDSINIEVFTDANYVITPNSDGNNDYFSIFTENSKTQGGSPIDSVRFTWEKCVDKDAANIQELTGRVYNRYGHVVCEWNSVEEALQGWDGTEGNKGNLYVADGFYYFVVVVRLKYKDENDDFDKLKPYKGMIYVIKEL